MFLTCNIVDVDCQDKNQREETEMVGQRVFFFDSVSARTWRLQAMNSAEEGLLKEFFPGYGGKYPGKPDFVRFSDIRGPDIYQFVGTEDPICGQ